MIPDEEGIAAVRAARAVTEAETEGRELDVPLPASFSKRRSGAFVTVNEYPSHMLRGCIGYPAPPFDMATALTLAARGVCSDPRFPRLTKREAERCVFEVSLLTVPERIEYTDPGDLVSKIRLGTDGIIVRRYLGRTLVNSALFLPQVPGEQGWDMDEYIGNLCRKAGMPYDEWKNNGLEFEKFQAEVFGEESPGGEVRRM